MTTESRHDQITEAMAAAEFRQDPYPLYSTMRRDHRVHRSSEGNWYLTRHEDVEAALHDRRLSNDRDRISDALAARQGGMQRVSEFTRRLGPVITNTDPPAHTRLRMLVNKAFTARRVQGCRPRVQAIVDALIDSAEVAGRTMDLVATVSSPLPYAVSCDLFGIPFDDRDRVVAWLRELDEPIGAVSDRLELIEQFDGYLDDLIHRRRAQPTDDVIGALAEAHDGDDRLDDYEMRSTCFVLLTAGGETTTNLIGNGTLALLRHPDQLRRLQHDPTLIRSAVDELVRYDTPTQMIIRVVAEAIDVGGYTLPVGELVYLVLAATNRDPQRYAEPDRLDLGRSDNRHVSFGGGRHSCLGAPLSRLQGEVVIGTLMRRFPALRLDTEAVEWRPGPVMRGPVRLPVAY